MIPFEHWLHHVDIYVCICWLWCVSGWVYCIKIIYLLSWSMNDSLYILFKERIMKMKIGQREREIKYINTRLAKLISHKVKRNHNREKLIISSTFCTSSKHLPASFQGINFLLLLLDYFRSCGSSSTTCTCSRGRTSS